MKPWRPILWGCVLAIGGAMASPAQAAWDNVFQVSCFHCGRNAAPAPAATSYYADPCCNPCPPVCTTRYVQRCYYQPVTCYQTKTYYEPVTTYRTSYYCQPVTSYRYSCYYDPCTCQYQQVACPTVSYQLRSQCCPVQSWVQRCCRVPVTSYQAYSVWEPVTTCCQPAAPACPPSNGYAGLPQTQTSQPPILQGQPGVSEQRLVPQPGVQEYRQGGVSGSGSQLYDRYYNSRGISLQQNDPRVPTAPPAPVPVNSPPAVKLQNIVAIPNPPVPAQIVRHEKKTAEREDW
jgi:hypothetical protein